jgi:carbon monoxide dehydrogenase subunit G
MEIDKSVSLNASASRVWALLLDPQAMGACVPGMESIEVLTPEEYKAMIKVKIAFVSARFTLRTRIVERRQPLYLKAEGVGEDAAVASSLKYVTEIHLHERPDGGTDLHIKVQVDLLGRMGNFGLSVMKTKADRLWDEFGVQLAAQLVEVPPGAVAGLTSPLPKTEQAELGTAPTEVATMPSVQGGDTPSKTVPALPAQAPGLWSRCLRAMGIQPDLGSVNAGSIVVEIKRPDQTQIRVVWPQSQSAECLQWLKDLTR